MPELLCQCYVSAMDAWPCRPPLMSSTGCQCCTTRQWFCIRQCNKMGTREQHAQKEIVQDGRFYLREAVPAAGT